MSLINPVTLALVRSALDAGSLRQAAVAHNIANASTDGFRPFRVVYEERLDAVRSLVRDQRTNEIDPGALPAAQLRQEADARPVSLDSEVAALSQNALQYQALSKALGHQFALMSMATSEGKR